MARTRSVSRMGKRKYLVYASLTALCLALSGGAAPALSLEKAPAQQPAVAQSAPEKSQQLPEKQMVVAKVNNDAITMDALVKMMNRLGAGEGGGADVSSLQQQALNRLILIHLAYQKAQRDGMQADAKNVEAALDNLKKNLGGEAEYKDFLAKEGVSEEELKSQITRSLTLELVYAREVYGKVSVPEEEIKKLYEKEKARYTTAEKMRVTDVLFLQQDKADATLKNAKEVLKKIKADKGQDPWSLTLDGTFIVRTYDINPERDKELYKEGKKLKDGQLSGIIKTEKGVHIVKMKEYAPSRQMSFEEVRNNLEASLRLPAQDRRLQEWEQELRKEAKIEIVWPELTKKNS